MYKDFSNNSLQLYKVITSSNYIYILSINPNPNTKTSSLKQPNNPENEVFKLPNTPWKSSSLTTQIQTQKQAA